MSIVVKDEVRYDIKDGVLINITDLSRENRKEIVIPHTFENGDRIDVIGSNLSGIKGYNRVCDKIIISDEISEVHPYAFSEVSVKTIQWSKGCKKIPFRCFAESTVEQITNIENVRFVEGLAFANSNIKTIVWPSSCHLIPAGCFLGSSLETIDGLEKVTEIQGNAFEGCRLSSFEWPLECSVVPRSCFSGCIYLNEVSNMHNVAEIQTKAFENCALEGILDLSDTIAMSIEKAAFYGVAEENVIFPYYMPQPIINNSFRPSRTWRA